MAPGALLTWLGQSGFLVELGGVRIAIDLFLGEHEARTYPPASLESLGEPLEWLLATHEHLDHLDTSSLPAIVARHPSLRIVLPAPLVPVVEDIVPSSQIVPVQPGDIVALAPDVEIVVLPAFHGVSVEDGHTSGASGDSGARFVGYVLRGSDIGVYHSGDTIVTRDLVDALADVEIDVALLPINGRDYYREEVGLVGNMNVREAVRLAQTLGVDTLVPMHWDMFAGNTERPGTVLDEVAEAGATLHVLTPTRLKPFRVVSAERGQARTRVRPGG